MIVLKYGGSRLRPGDSYDDKFISSLISLVQKYDEQFMIIVGGGALARGLQEKGSLELGKLYSPDEDLLEQGKDLIGIKATRENARYVIKNFTEAGVDVYHTVLIDPTTPVKGKHKVYLAGGWKPGWSTDYVAMKYAQKYSASTVIKVSDFNYVKDVSPLRLQEMSKVERDRELAKASVIKKATWKKMVELVGTTWIPGLHTPLDPLAAALGLKNSRIRLFIVSESQVENILEGKNVEGTVVFG